MTRSLASLLTRAGSTQTYYTIRLLVDPGRIEDAYRAYAYYRWVDDVVDAKSGWSRERQAFLARQESLLDRCYRGEPPRSAIPQENMLVELIEHDREEASGLQCYLRNMMLVMRFDVERRGRLISEAELSQYTRWLARAVTEAMHYFIGRSCYAPEDDTRYLAVSGAHITHMLRDMLDDVQAGYFNIPREVLLKNHIAPQDVNSDIYRAWVQSRVQVAREYFEAGRDYLSRVQSLRCRLAGFAYIERFEWLLDTIEREGHCLRPRYDERRRVGTGLRMSWLVLSSIIRLRQVESLSRPNVS